MPAARFLDSSIEVLTLPPVKVAALEHHGTAKELEDLISLFMEWRQREGLLPRQHPTYTILYPPSVENAEEVAQQDEPTPLEDSGEMVSLAEPHQGEDVFRMDLAATIYGHLAPNPEGLLEKTITGGRYAVVTVRGTEDDLRQAITYISTDWITRSGETLRQAPVIVQRVAQGDEGPMQATVMNLQIPLV